MKNIKFVFISVFGLILFVFFGCTIVNHYEISSIEKRKLVTFPEFSFKSLFKSEYYDTLTTAFNDQLLMRGLLVKGYYLFQFQRYLGDVVVGDNNQMFSAIQTAKDMKSYEKGLIGVSSKLNDLADELKKNGVEFIFLSIPRKDAVMKKYLPSSYVSSDTIYKKGSSILKQNLSTSVKFMDAYDIFTSNVKYNYYFKNDHHINIRGGQLLYKEIMNEVKKTHPEVKTYELEELYKITKTAVNGAFNKQIGQSIKPSIEELNLTLRKDIDYIRYEDDVKSDLDVLGSGTSYETAFMAGDNAYTRIETNRSNLPNIMYVGSSFSNILEALSIPSFNRMVSIDYRHNKSNMSIKDYVAKYDINYVVFIPSQSNDALSVNQIYLHLGY